MFQSVLSVLLFGMVTVSGSAPANSLSARLLHVTSPSPLRGLLADALQAKQLTASSTTIVDAQTSETLYERNAEERRPIASLTKLMTAILIMENHPLDEWVTVPKGVATIPDIKVRLAPGHHFRVGDLLTAMLVSSSNDAAYALAVHHSGSEASFVQEMNDRAVALGLTDTSFANAAGFDDPQQWSTARDVSRLALFAFRFPELKSRLSLQGATIKSREGARVALEQTHLLLKSATTPVVAGKTGTTEEAGQCLLSLVRKNNREYLVILLASRERYSDMRMLLSVFASLLT